MIAGISTTQDMLDFCAKNKLFPDIEHVEAKQIDECWEKLTTSNKDGIRYVIDVEKSKKNKDWLPASE